MFVNATKRCCIASDAVQTSIDRTLALQGLDRLAEYDYVAIFDADFKPDADFLVSHSVSFGVQVDIIYFLLSL